MKRTKELIALILTLVMLLHLLLAVLLHQAKSAPEETANPLLKKVRLTRSEICIITSTGVDDSSFNQNCYEGIQAFLANHSVHCH